jgi:raffinose/stachyose/melibiose transport system permease protein
MGSQRGKLVAKYATLFVILVFFALPLYLVFSVSAKSDQDFLSNPLGLPQVIRWSNYSEAIEAAKFFRLLSNSVLIAGMGVALAILLGALAAYPIARRNRGFHRALYLFFLAGMMVPFQIIMIPLFEILKGLALINTHIGVICVFVGIYLPFVVFFLVGYMKAIPYSFDEAALIDGASRLRVFISIMLPLSTPAMGTLAVIQTIWIWNELLIPLIFLFRYEKMTIVIGIYRFVGERAARWNMIFALILVSIVPIIVLYALLQKHIIRSFAAGGLKG